MPDRPLRVYVPPRPDAPGAAESPSPAAPGAAGRAGLAAVRSALQTACDLACLSMFLLYTFGAAALLNLFWAWWHALAY